LNPVELERGNLADEIKYATQIFGNFRTVKFFSSERKFALILNNEPTHVGCYDKNQNGLWKTAGLAGFANPILNP
jgi:hypothetical protein